ncbi:MAG TPA: XRE family transcriptional regulator [Chitinophagales bacterium]|nr:XRE family transcriptional regulator [Chitinophagales bacterium]
MALFAQNIETKRFIVAFKKAVDGGVLQNSRQFCEKTGFSESSFSQIMNGRRNAPDVLIKKFAKLAKLDLEFFYQWNTNAPGYYTAGIEAQVVAEPGFVPGKKGSAVFIDAGAQVLMYVPLVNQYAYAGYLSGYSDDDYLESLPKVPWLVEREYKGTYRTFEVRGDSMNDGSSDSYLEGDKILCREISPALWHNKLHITKWDFVVVHKTEGVLVKRILEHNVENGTLLLHSLNSLYPDLTISLKDVAQIFNVVQVARKK